MDAENIRAKVKKVFFDLFQKDESKIQDSYCLSVPKKSVSY